MNILFAILLSLCGLVLLGCFYMLRRNEWVAQFRRDELDRDMDAYLRLVDYDAMMLRFWCWDRNPATWLKHR